MTEARSPRRKATGFRYFWNYPAVIAGAGILAIGFAMNAVSAMDEKQAWPDRSRANDRGAAQSSAVSRDAMLNSNADSYAARLRKNGGSLKEWMQLVRLYGVLGKNHKALKALASAKNNLRHNPQAIRRLDRFAKLVGLKR